ncbi:MAG: flagellar biosynthesis repressor FlbT [Alphaproteobacteria bacterium]|jgi:flagellar protein FlbT|nr:flagellar biosynthesis repressor FlbT [Alphaproteobacteria bacterium]
MALIIDLKPGEKILIGTTVITNDDQRTRLHIAGEAPILREKDVMFEEQADTPCKKVYLLVQCMYLARNPREYHPKYFEMLKMIQTAAPSTAVFFMRINEQIIQGHYYRALREAKDLIVHEQELLANVNAASL